MRIETVGQTSMAAKTPVQATAPAPSAPEQKPAAPVAVEQVSAPAAYQPAADMQNVVATINKYLRDTAKSVQFNIDASTGKTVVSVVDSNTHEVIRQMPSEETLAIARAISRLSGLLLDEKA
jgi:flagellar protein FlaG